MIPGLPDMATTNDAVAQVVQVAIAPVFLLAGIGAFLNVCVGRLARIVDRARSLEPKLYASRGPEHDRIIDELHILDRRIKIVNAAIFLSVSAAVLICVVVILLFAGGLLSLHVGTAIALLFIAAMTATALGFAVFLHETRIGTRAVRVRSAVLEHRVDPDDA